jgi:multidrug efflux pump subunit AcrB
VADYRFTKAPTFVERNDGAEVIRIGCMPQDDNVDIVGIAEELDPEIRKLTDKVKGLSFLWTGYVAEHEESVKKTWLNAAFLIFALYALLAIPFRSVVQPIYVLLAVPFGVIGALLGHLIMDITPNFLSVFGMLALAGVVVNDSLVMVDFVNSRRRAGMPLIEAALAAGARRFRPHHLNISHNLRRSCPLADGSVASGSVSYSNGSFAGLRHSFRHWDHLIFNSLRPPCC